MSLSARAAEPPNLPLTPLSRHPFPSAQSGATPLHIASENGHLPVVDRLVAARADVEAKKTVLRYAGVVGLGGWPGLFCGTIPYPTPCWGEGDPPNLPSPVPI